MFPNMALKRQAGVSQPKQTRHAAVVLRSTFVDVPGGKFVAWASGWCQPADSDRVSHAVAKASGIGKNSAPLTPMASSSVAVFGLGHNYGADSKRTIGCKPRKQQATSIWGEICSAASLP
jgi:hypothetical protein